MHFHVTIPSEGRFEAFTDPALLRRAVRAMARVMGPSLISWALPGNHVHATACGARAEVGLLARNLRFSFRALGIRLDEAHHRRITDADDLRNVVAYQLRQAQKHAISDRPALFEGGCFLDLVGARFVEGFDPKLVLKHLPRFDIARHLHEVAARGLPTPIPESEIRSVGAMRLIEATGSALAVGPDLAASDGPPFVAARRVAVALGTAAGISRKELAFALDLAPQSIGRLERALREPRLELVVRTRLGVDAMALIVERKPEKR